MNINKVRRIVADAYPSPSWRRKVAAMTDAQVFAVYNRLISSGRIKNS